MKLRRILVRTNNGPAVSVVEVDPPLLPGEVEINVAAPPPCPPVARVNTKPIDEVALAALVAASRK